MPHSNHKGTASCVPDSEDTDQLRSQASFGFGTNGDNSDGIFRDAETSQPAQQQHFAASFALAARPKSRTRPPIAVTAIPHEVRQEMAAPWMYGSHALFI
eukprot:1949654-Amphidinium_carterae.1